MPLLQKSKKKKKKKKKEMKRKRPFFFSWTFQFSHCIWGANSYFLPNSYVKDKYLFLIVINLQRKVHCYPVDKRLLTHGCDGELYWSGSYFLHFNCYIYEKSGCEKSLVTIKLKRNLLVLWFHLKLVCPISND